MRHLQILVLALSIALPGLANAQLFGGGGGLFGGGGGGGLFGGGGGDDGGCNFFCQLTGGEPEAENPDPGDEGSTPPTGGDTTPGDNDDLAGGGGAGGGSADPDGANDPNQTGEGQTDGQQFGHNGDYGAPTYDTPASQRANLSVRMGNQDVMTRSGDDPVFGEHWRSEPPTLRRGDASGYLIAASDFSNIPPNAYSGITPNGYEGVSDCEPCSEQGCSASGIVVDEQCACDRSGSGIPYRCESP